MIITAALLVSSSALTLAFEASKEDAALSAKLIRALQTADYSSYIADGTTAFKKMKPEQFNAVATRLAPKLKAGHEVSYLGELKQKGHHITLWKVSFQDGSDDALARLSMKDGKVGSFGIR